ncbi:MAG: hypothetical protein HYY66_07475, partial [Candidatus Tectomicrobia bacterium]|nr:hypothetical protein [Candidatus Tectomicrobia bacterium]
MEWTLKNLGASAIIVAVVGIAAWKIWKDREHIGALVLTPVRPIRRIFPPRIPRVKDHNTFTLALAHLKDDGESHEMENLIWESLNELEGVRVLRIPRTVSFKNSNEEGHKAA